MAPAAPSPLVIRLRNWVGDVVLSVPTLLRLEAAGHELHLVGKGWVPDLLAGYGWRCRKLAGSFRGRVAQWRELRRELGPTARSLVFPYSFSSALECRLGGLPAVGFAGEGRGLLLGRAVPRPREAHTLAEYWSLGQALLGRDEPPPPPSPWRFSAAAESEAARLRADHGLGGDYVVLVPFASGGADDARVWPDFPLLASELAGRGTTVVLCPGNPAEAAAAAVRYPRARVLPGVGMSAYGALMRDARLVVASDTGPGHLAAAAGARLLSLFGPSDPARWAPLGPSVELVRRWPAWPSVAEVLAKSVSPRPA